MTFHDQEGPCLQPSSIRGRLHQEPLFFPVVSISSSIQLLKFCRVDFKNAKNDIVYCVIFYFTAQSYVLVQHFRGLLTLVIQ